MPVSAVNQPAARTAEAGQPLPLLSYSTIVQELGIDQPGVSVAAALRQSAGVASWEAVWAASAMDGWDDLNPANFRGQLSDSPTKLYSLVVREKTVEVLYGWKTCRPLAASGIRQAGLVGDRRARAGVEVQPKLMVVGTASAHQDAAFEKVTVRPMSFADIQTAFQNDADAELVAAAEDGAAVPY